MPGPDISSDATLLERVARADPQALERLYDRHAGYALAVARRIVGSREEAEEVVQDVFWRLWRSSIQYDPGRGQFRTWLFGICRNRAIDSLRRRARRPGTGRVPSELELADGPRSEDLVFEKQQRRRVEAALARLSAPQRTAIELSFYQGLTHREIADRTGEPLGTIKSRIHGGMARLRESLGRAGVAS